MGLRPEPKSTILGQPQVFDCSADIPVISEFGPRMLIITGQHFQTWLPKVRHLHLYVDINKRGLVLKGGEQLHPFTSIYILAAAQHL